MVFFKNLTANCLSYTFTLNIIENMFLLNRYFALFIPILSRGGAAR